MPTYLTNPPPYATLPARRNANWQNEYRWQKPPKKSDAAPIPCAMQSSAANCLLPNQDAIGWFTYWTLKHGGNVQSTPAVDRKEVLDRKPIAVYYTGIAIKTFPAALARSGGDTRKGLPVQIKYYSNQAPSANRTALPVSECLTPETRARLMALCAPKAADVIAPCNIKAAQDYQRQLEIKLLAEHRKATAEELARLRAIANGNPKPSLAERTARHHSDEALIGAIALFKREIEVFEEIDNALNGSVAAKHQIEITRKWIDAYQAELDRREQEAADKLATVARPVIAGLLTAGAQLAPRASVLPPGEVMILAEWSVTTTIGTWRQYPKDVQRQTLRAATHIRFQDSAVGFEWCKAAPLSNIAKAPAGSQLYRKTKRQTERDMRAAKVSVQP
jgi:hypothetical protein